VGSRFIGPAPLGQVRLHHSQPTGQYHKAQRLHAIMGEGGLTDTTATGELGRQTAAQWFRDLFHA